MWCNYELAARCRDESDECRSATLLTCIGSEALDIMDGLQFDNEADRQNVDSILEKFEGYCVGETNETWERYQFNRREQEQYESIDTYVAVLRTLAKTCNYGTLEETLIRDRMIIGIRDNATRKRLLQTTKLTLKDCIQICRSHESATRRLKSMSVTEDVQSVNRNKKSGGDRKSKPTKPKGQPQQSQSATEGQCKFCGKRHVFGRKLCPAWGKTCNKCKKTNHFAAQCTESGGKRPKEKIQMVDDEDEYVLTLSETECVNSLNSDHGQKYPKRIFSKMVMNRKEVDFQLDCGSTVNIIPETLYCQIYDDPSMEKVDKNVNTTLRMYNGTVTKPVGKRRVSVHNPKNDRNYSVEFLIASDGHCKPILGSRAIQQMKLITVNFDNILLMTGKDNLVPGTVGSDPVKLEMSDINLKYQDLFEGEGKLEGLLHLEIDKTVKPVQLPCRKIPVAIQTQLKEELERLTDMNIITPVNVPTDWISALVVVKKPNTNKLRICIDPKPLNRALKRNHYPMMTIDDILPELSKAKCFTLADAKNGFWHVQLDEESSFLTTFETPWGRFRWLRMPFGISPAPEEFQRRLNDAISGLNRVRAVHDDVLIYGVGDTFEEAEVDHDRKLTLFLDRCRDKNIKLNKSKLKFKLPEVPYLGHILTADGLKIDPTKVEAIRDMPAPTDKHGVQRLLGMVNYLQKFAPNLSEATAPLRSLLKDKVHFRWDENVHGECLRRIKGILSEPPVLKYFDNDIETTLQCDASQSGLGACLIQKGQPVAYASRSMTSTEQHYAQIEKELLAIVFAMERFEQFVYGRKVTVESDHKPLESILRKSLLSAPKRLQRMMLRLQKYEFEVIYKRGSEMFLADTLSRAYLPHVQRVEMQNGDVLSVDTRCSTAIETESVNMVDYLAISDKRIAEIQTATGEDDSMKFLKDQIQNGWPETVNEIPYCTREYFPFRDELSVQNGIIFKGERVVIPLSIRPSVMERIHSSHIGVQGCIRRARELVYWPNMTTELTEFIGKCETCNTLSQAQKKEPLISHEVPSRPWEKLGCDLFEFDQKDYLIVVDYYSDYFEIDKLHDKRAPEIIKKMKAQLARHGIPDQIITDNGPPFNSDAFRRFSENYEFEHVTSSPRYPQSNGRVENAVKTAKRLLTKSLHSKGDPYMSLLDWRNVPTEGIGTSPVQRLFGRRTKTKLPTTAKLLQPKTVEDVTQKLTGRKLKQAWYYNRSATELSALKEGDVVRIKPSGYNKEWRKAVVDQKVDIRSYQVRTEDGSSLRRNRRHLRLSSEAPPHQQPEVVYEPDRPVSESEKQDLPVPECATPEVSHDNLNPANRTVPDEPMRRTSGRTIKPPARYKDFVLK